MSKPKLFATIADINIYHVHKDGYGKGRESVYLFSTSSTTKNHWNYIFDTRSFLPEANRSDWENADGSHNPNWLEAYEQKQKDAIATEIKAGKITKRGRRADAA